MLVAPYGLVVMLGYGEVGDLRRDPTTGEVGDLRRALLCD
jgi:hypothetical protein